ncbi:haloalkane dehalogenase [Actinomadura geliboluensis]|uniref:haloalkane dehalogenase n=1 Tax=Actinomadura geliboluensis TaxID=882440 RepID=UPI003713ACFB
MPTAPVLDSTIFYREVGRGPTPTVFLHGNPTSSYLWRHVLPVVGAAGRCLAPDLIGMGESGKPDIAYSFDDHARYLDAWFDALELDRVVLVGHDWGGALAFDWAARHPGRVRGIAFTETIVKPMSWEEFPAGARPLFEAMRSPGVGEAMVLEENAFIEQALPRTVPGLSEEDLAVYGRPYPTRRSRVPLLQWPRSMPLDGEPADVVARIDAYGQWLVDSADVPKLLVAFEPGESAMMSAQIIDWCTAHMSALEIETHGTAGHHTPEEQPEAIASSLVAWLDEHDLLSTEKGRA